MKKDRKGLDLLLVNPRGGGKNVYQGLSEDFSAIEPPFWAALTAGFIRNKGYEAAVLDANALGLDAGETAEKILNSRPRLINIVCSGQQPASSTQIMPAAGLLCREIKGRDREASIILTGLHPCALPEETMKQESCDFVGEEEGFYALWGLLREKDVARIPGLWYRRGG